MKKTKDGITLIALIITIIVMLILVAVSVRATIKSGLFEKAKDASESWAKEQEYESHIGDDIDDLIKKYGDHEWKRNGDNIYCDHCELSFTIGDFIDYKPDTTTEQVKVGKEEAGLLETIRTNTETIDPTTVEDQIFTQDTNTYWQVLGVEDTNNDGKNETLLIKMAFGTSKQLALKGAKAYDNGPDIMNKIAEELYSSSEYGKARSINITDINNVLQYTPPGGIYFENGTWKQLDGFNTSISDLTTWDAIRKKEVFDMATLENRFATYTVDNVNTEERLGEYKINGYWYSWPDETSTTIVENPTKEVRSNITTNTSNIIFFTPKGDKASYYLACHGVFADAENVIWGPGSVSLGGVNTYSFTFYSTGYISSSEMSVVPVVSLTNKIPPKIEAPNF